MEDSPSPAGSGSERPEPVPPAGGPPPPDAAGPPPAWPPWFAWVGFVGALIATAITVGIILGVAGTDSEDGSAAVTLVAVAVQGIFFVGAALVLARSVARPRRWHFGLRAAPFWPTVGWAALGMLTFYVLGAIYAVLVDPAAEQDVVENLGAGDSTLGLIVAGVTVIAVAPLIEEFFFRGFFYRALRSRYPIALAAIVDGLVFGVLHYDFEGADGLLLLPPLALLGVLFCLVYERTKTLWAPIGMHAFNNMLAFAAQADDGWKVAVAVGPLMLAAVAIAPRLMSSGPSPLPPGRAPVERPAQLSLPIE